MVEESRRGKALVFVAISALVFDTCFRVGGFDRGQYFNDVGNSLYSYSRQVSLVSEQLIKELHFGDGDPMERQDIHSSNAAVLDLLDWEENCIKEGSLLVVSNETQRSRDRQLTSRCRPPPRLVSDCCEGDFSSGGTLINIAMDKCASSFETSAHRNSSLQMRAREFLAKMPLPSQSANNIGGNKDDNTTDMACDICRIVEISRQNNLTVVFLGDSMQAQVFQGLIYELQRRQYSTHLRNNATHREGFWKTKIQYRETLTIQSQDWLEDDKLPSAVTMKLFQLYILPFEYPEELEEVVNAGDILVLGFGLHWNSDLPQFPLSTPDTYTSTMSDLLSYVKHNGTRTKLLVHRQTSAQHFDAPVGDYSIWSKIPERINECKPILSRDKYLSTWREECVKKAAIQAGYRYTMASTRMESLFDHDNMNHLRSSLSRLASPQRHPLPQNKLFVLPYFNFTVSLWDQHPPEKIADCTHYCPSPFLYLPLWRSFRIVLDQQFEAMSIGTT